MSGFSRIWLSLSFDFIFFSVFCGGRDGVGLGRGYFDARFLWKREGSSFSFSVG